ncbi:MAG TPA: aldehyde dehydrogenase family protein, partial [Pseudomonadales bacterium]|nr:aldehyde dehydrogenase family protein [Pseudomonadales bacterium]
EMIKKSVLELGGSDPFIVLADADVENAANLALATRLQFNAGQSCISAKRFIVEAGIADAFIQHLTEATARLVVGDPMAEDTDVGPLSSEQIRSDVEKQVAASIEKGARLICGGERLSGKGYFYTPAILANVTSGMAVYHEEVFGPVMPVISVKDADEAVKVANDSDYGLAGAIFSADVTRAEDMARRMETGSVFINGQVKSDPRLPFGGVKQSGYGRELSHQGIKEFVNIKTIWVK